MHQLASSVLSFFLSPFNWVIILLATAYFIHNALYKKIGRILALCIFLLFSNAWLLDWYAKHWQPSPVQDPSGVGYSCGIVLGGFVSPGDHKNGYFNAAADRFIQTVKLYKLGTINHILVCGGNGKPDQKNFREAQWVKHELIVMGIPDSVIFIEDRSDNTSDNARYAKKIMDSLELTPPYLLISSAHHLPRASLLFKNAGIATVSFPCNYVAGRGNFKISSLLPQPAVMEGWNVYLKETAGYFWYRLRGK
jgi:uncharacterized SAM-binding protein YcdF (DUF218 family)